MAGSSGESQLQRIIRDLQDAVTELNKEFTEAGEPITDDCVSLHKFSYKLEYLLQFDQKEKSTLLGHRKDYWDYFSDCLAKVKGANDGIRFVKSISELRTSLGKGRAFLRYSLVHQRLADTLQQCFMNTKVTSDWYYARSPFLNPKMSSDIIGHLYELTEVQFDLASRGYDLDSAWPTFARRTLSSLGSSAYLWKPPSRSSSMSSLVSNYLQAQEIPSSPNGNNFLNNEPLEGLDELHTELDQAELRQKELQDQIHHLEKENQTLQAAVSFEQQQAQAERENSGRIREENVRLTKMLEELEKQREISYCTQGTVQDLQKCLQVLELNAAEKQSEYSARLEELEASKRTLTRKQKNEELIAKTLLNEKGQQTKQYESALKFEELQKKVRTVEQEKVDACKLNDKHLSQLKVTEEELHLKDDARKELELKLENLTISSKGKEAADLQIQLKDSLECVKSLGGKLEEEREEKVELERSFSLKKTRMEQEVKNTMDQLVLLEIKLSELSQRVNSLEEQKSELVSERDYLRKILEKMEQQKLEDKWRALELREENKLLDENLQNATRQSQVLEERVKTLQKDYQELKQNEDTMKESLSVLEAKLQSTKEHCLQMENNLSSLRKNEESLKTLLKEKDEALQCLESQCKKFQGEIERCRKKVKILEAEKADIENMCLHQTKVIESISSEKTSLEKAQLEHTAEVGRLQEKMMDLQAKFQQTVAEKEKLQGKLDIHETVLNEHKSLALQLKEQNEALNRNHVQELLQCQEQEEGLKKERDQKVHQKAEMEKSVLCLTDELSRVKQCLEMVNMENMEIKDLLHRTNTEMAELGIQICTLTSEKADAEEKLSQLMEELSATKERAAKDQEELHNALSRLSQEKEGLQEKLEDSEIYAATVPDLRTQLETAERQAQSLQEFSKEELSAVKFQLSTEIINYQTKFKAVNEECEHLQRELEKRSQQVSIAEEALKDMQVGCIYGWDKPLSEVLESTYICVLVDLTNGLNICYDNLNKMKSDRDSNEKKLLAELDDLTRTKQFLEERLIELLRDKDALWQKSDALEFQQKLTAEQRWLGDAEVSSCLDCQKEFGWMNRRHHCRLCGRIFCYYCCNNYAMSKQTGKKERCCQSCFKKASNSGSNVTQEESTSSLLASPLSLVQRVIGRKVLNDYLLSLFPRNSTLSSLTFDESDDLQMIQDVEICLLKSGELMLKLPLTAEDIFKFGEANRELFIKSNTYSTIPITVIETGLTISWVFSSEPKSISFSVVYQESEEAPLDQSKVLIPMTRCNSHKETIHGKVKVRNPGIYILIFDNTFSRFISKKVFFHLAAQRPIIYDGSDFP
uniref:FYVE and coiled-coil domain-containing protein 1 n=1 Tax=Anolis carolinensis TaxID=28377 RepID=H9GKQ5_ANOCA